MAAVDEVGLLRAETADDEDEFIELVPGERSPHRRGSSRRGALAGALLLFAVVASHTLMRSGRGPKVAAVAGGAGAPLGLAEQECHGIEAGLQPGQGDAYLWRCYQGQCIDTWRRCDGTPDCMDGSDEVAGCPVQAAAQPQQPQQPQFQQQVQQPQFQQQPAAAAQPQQPQFQQQLQQPQFQQQLQQPQAPPQGAAPASGGCVEHNGYQYTLNWKAEGQDFFREWNFLQNEPNSGAAEYVTGGEARSAGMTQAFQNVAVIKPGGPGNAPLKRKSVKMETQRKWTYFLMTMKYEAIPWGCGVWPALWTHSPDAGWPAGGELDILEYSNEITSRTSLHTAESNRCKLNWELLNKPGCPTFTDAEYDFTGHYDCVTSYPEKIGCAPNDRLKMLDGEKMSNDPGVVAVEWTPDFVKTFRIPNSQMPADLAGDAPRPDNWDAFVTGYYPFAESERTVPGSCPNPGGVMKAQQIVLSLGFCGDWASKVYVNSTCANKGYSSGGPWSAKGPVMPSQCVAVDPHNPMGETPAGPRDCCTNFIADPQGAFGTQQYLDEHGAWKINYVKVYQAAQLR